MLPRFVELAMELTEGVSAGFSLYEPEPAPGIFRWRHLHGSLAAFENATTPRNFSPCGVTLDQNRPVLARHAERFYSWISDAHIVVPEVLLVPLLVGDNETLGTLWIVSDEDGHFFDSGDVRVASPSLPLLPASPCTSCAPARSWNRRWRNRKPSPVKWAATG